MNNYQVKFPLVILPRNVIFPVRTPFFLGVWFYFFPMNTVNLALLSFPPFALNAHKCRGYLASRFSYVHGIG